MKRSVYFLYSFTCLVSFIMILLVTTTAYAEWHFQDSGTSETLNDVCFVDEMHGWAVGYNSTIIATTDGGETWVKQECPVDGLILIKLEFVNNQTGYCLSRSDYLFATRDGGLNWDKVDTCFKTLGYFSDMSFIDDDTGWITAGVIVGLEEKRLEKNIYFTDNGGNSWKNIYSLNLEVPAIYFIDKNTGWALYGGFIDALDDTKVLHTIDGGKEWNELSFIQGTPNILYVVSPDTLWIGWTGLYKSYDGGITWTSVKVVTDLRNHTRLFYPIDGQRVYVLIDLLKMKPFVSFHGYELHYTCDGGKTFTKLLDFTRDFFSCKAMSGFGKEHLWLVGYDGKILKYSKDTVSVKESKESIPQSVKLFQNTPNPFNNTTTIRFSLAKSDHIELAVYDITGRKVAILLSDMLKSGYYSVVWDGKDSKNDSYVSSGVYIYELSSSTFKERKKMLFVR